MRGRIVAAVIVAAAIVALRTPSAQSSRSVWDGVYTEQQAARGESFFMQSCARCHRPDLAGGDEVPPLSGPLFLSNWNGLTVGDLLERIRISMPPDDPTRLGRQQKADIVAYLLRFNKFPQGDTELARESQALKEIQFQASKP